MKLLATALALGATALFACGPAVSGDNTITVAGKAELKHKPDVAYVTLYVKADGILMIDAAKEADRKVGEIRSAMEEKFKDIQSFDIVEVAVGEKGRDYFGPDRADETPRPEITRRLRIALPPDRKQVYEIIDIAIRAGALMDSPSSIQYPGDDDGVVVYGLVKSSELEEKARQAAMADAKEQARKTAALADKTIGDVVKIECASFAAWNIPMRFMGEATDFPTEHIGTNPDEVTISHAMSVTFELQSE